MEQGKLGEAVACHRRALEVRPDHAEAHDNLGNALKEQGKLDEAVACYRRALELKPDFAEAHNNLGNALKEQGKLDEAVACYRRALELKPDFAERTATWALPSRSRGSWMKRSPATAGPGTEAGVFRGTRQPGQRFGGDWRSPGARKTLSAPRCGTIRSLPSRITNWPISSPANFRRRTWLRSAGYWRKCS